MSVRASAVRCSIVGCGTDTTRTSSDDASQCGRSASLSSSQMTVLYSHARCLPSTLRTGAFDKSFSAVASSRWMLSLAMFPPGASRDALARISVHGRSDATTARISATSTSRADPPASSAAAMRPDATPPSSRAATAPSTGSYTMAFR